MRPFKELRTDPHRPSVMDPSEYVFVGAADNHPGRSYIEIDHKRLAAQGIETGSSDEHNVVNVPFFDATEHGRPNFRCHHCGKHGAGIHYFCFFLHKPTKQVIVVGRICAENRLALSSREEYERFLHRRDRHQGYASWAEKHPQEYRYLQEYSEVEDFYQEFLDSLWGKLHEFGSLTERQIEGLRRWMVKGKPWERQTREIDPDRHAGEVIHGEEPPTEGQIDYIKGLCEGLGKDPRNYVRSLQSRLHASNVINDLKAEKIQRQPQGGWENDPATSNQLTTINRMMDERQMPLAKRREARRQLDAGLTKGQASKWIDKLKELPKIGEADGH